LIDVLISKKKYQSRHAEKDEGRQEIGEIQSAKFQNMINIKISKDGKENQKDEVGDQKG